MMVIIHNASGLIHKPGQMTQAPVDTGMRPCVCCLPTNGKAQNAGLFNCGYAIGGMPTDAVLPLIAPSGIDHQSSFKWSLAEQFTMFNRQQMPRSIACEVGNACPLMFNIVNILEGLREYPYHGNEFVYRIVFSRSGTGDAACPPMSQTDQKEPYPMTTYTKIPLDGIFVSPTTPSFAELIDQLQTNDALTTERRKDLISGLRRVAEALQRTPAQVPADPRWLQPRLAAIAPAAIRVNTKTWQNIVSNARSAMVACGIVTKRHRQPRDLSSDWQPLWECVRDSKDKSLLSPLPRFVFFLNRIGVAPANVSNDHALLFLEAIELNEISKSPQSAFKDAVMGWNRAIERLPSWPRQRLELPSQAKRVMLQEAEYTPSLITDIDRYLGMRMRPDLLAPEQNFRPIAASSAASYRYLLLRFASHVIRAGIPSQDIVCLLDLLQTRHVELGLRRMLALNDGKTSASISDTAGLLLTIAAHLELSQDVRNALAQFKARLAMRDTGGMTVKNRDRLRVLRAPGVLRRLLRLPEGILTRPLGNHRSKALRAWEDAIAIGILLYCPLRVSNLAKIDISRHLPRAGKKRMYLVIPANEVKNKRPLEFELPPHLVKMIEAYLAARAPTLCAPDCLYLFPATRKNGPVSKSDLAERIKRRVRSEVGIDMNAHLFRHLAVMIYLDANPGGYEVARQMLGHSSVSRTISVYSGLETISATQAFAKVVNTLREAG